MKKILNKGLLCIGVCLLLLCLCSCRGEKTDDPSSTAAPFTVETPPSTTAPESTAPQTAAPAAPTESTTAAPQKKGDMIFTEDANDPFMQAIVQKYNVDPARLAGIYMSPASDSNYFWEFDGTTDANGKLVRNADTLKYVYTVTADRSKICRTGGLTGNDGLTAAQGYVVFETNKQLMVPKFEARLAGN